MDNLKTLSELDDLARQFDADEADFKVPVRDVVLGYNPDGLTASWDVGGAYDLRSGAVKDLAGLVGIPPVYLANCPPDLQFLNAAYWLNERATERSRSTRNGADQLTVRTSRGDVRAMMSGVYTPIHNGAITEIVRNAVGNDTRLTLVRPYITADKMYVKVLVAGSGLVGTQDRYGFGFAVSNDELGEGGLEVQGLVQRHACTNSAVIGGRWNWRHAYYSPQAMLNFMSTAIADALRFSSTMADRVIAAASVRIPNISKVLDDLLKDKGIGEDARRVAQRGMEPRMGNTLEAIIAGITWAGHQSDNDSGQALEELAGDVLAARLFTREWATVGIRPISESR